MADNDFPSTSKSPSREAASPRKPYGAEEALLRAEARKLNAEAFALERSQTSWWRLHFKEIASVVVTSAAAAVLLTAWFVGFFQPILGAEQELGKIELQTEKAKFELERMQHVQVQAVLKQEIASLETHR